LDAKGAVINSYNSDAPAPTGRGGRGGVVGAGETQTEDPDAAPTRRFGPPPPRVTKTAGLNRVLCDVRNKEGVTLPPGQYKARLKVDRKTSTEPFNVLIDPRVAEDGVTVVDLQEQFEHNMRVRQMVNDANQIAARVREFQTKVRAVSASGGPDEVNRVNAIASKLFTEPVRYGKPGLQAHITYLASMTANVDQKVGRDAIERYAVL